MLLHKTYFVSKGVLKLERRVYPHKTEERRSLDLILAPKEFVSTCSLSRQMPGKSSPSGVKGL